jgi:hypothetical protein
MFFLKSNIFFLILKIFPYFRPFDFESFETIKLIDIGDFLSLENFMSDLRLLPVPEIKTAVFILLDPVNRAI